MGLFRYKAIATNGRSLTGEMEAADDREVIAELRAAGHFPIYAKSKSPGSSLPSPLHFLARRRDRVPYGEVTVTTRELATLLAAGMPVDSALRILERHARRPALKVVVREVRDDLRAGKSMSAALEKHFGIFDAFYTSLIRAGEASGALDVVVDRLATHRERVEAFRSSLMSALMYPAILSCVAVLSLFIVMAFVVPQFVPLFGDAGHTLPLLTQIVFAISGFLSRYWWLLAGAVLGSLVAVDRWFRYEDNRLRFHAWILRVPVAGDLTRSVETVRFARTLETLLRNGVPLLKALGLVKQTIWNLTIARALEGCLEEVHSGGRLARSLARTEVFPDVAIDLIVMGEESGRLEDMLSRTADVCDASVQKRLKRLVALVEPVLVLGLGLVIAVVIIAILMAMLGLNDLVT